MMPLSPAMLMAAANVIVGLDGEDEDERMGALFLHEMKAPLSLTGRPSWDTAFVHHVGWWTHYDVKGDSSSWPIQPSASRDALAEFAEKHRAIREEPEAGDLFLLKSSLSERFARTGIVMTIGKELADPDGRPYRTCGTIEGDTDEQFSPTGGRILRHERRFSAERGDRFVRWTALDRRSLNARELRSGRDLAEMEAAA